jgi:hypothetical protein
LIGLLAFSPFAAEASLSQTMPPRPDRQIAQAETGGAAPAVAREPQGMIVTIPPSPGEVDIPLAPDVPTPPLNWTTRGGGSTLPGGALSGTGTGTSPASNSLRWGPGGVGPDGR